MGMHALGRLGAVALVLAATAAAARAEIEASPRYAAIVVDARSGQTIAAHHADEPRHPASLAKMMTLYLLFEALREGRLRLDSPIRMSEEAASRPPSKLGVPAGRTISAETAILALVTRSANDVAAAVAEHLAGSEEAFARLMTRRARELGMARTTFRNASGLPDPEQVTTARDMALLGRRLIQDFPERYAYFSATHFRHGGQLIRNHNGMLLDYPGADGIKTGFIRASGFNIVTSAEREGVRLVGAVFGGRSWAERNRQMAELLDEGFQRMGVRGSPALVAGGTRILQGREPSAAALRGTPAAGARPTPAVRVASAPSAPTARPRHAGPALRDGARASGAPRPALATSRGQAAGRPPLAAGRAAASPARGPAAAPARNPAAIRPQTSSRSALVAPAPLPPPRQQIAQAR